MKYYMEIHTHSKEKGDSMFLVVHVVAGENSSATPPIPLDVLVYFNFCVAQVWLLCKHEILFIVNYGSATFGSTTFGSSKL